MKSNGFFIVPYKELADLPLSRVQFYVYAYVLNYCKNTGVCSASISTISAATRWDERAVRLALTELVRDGYLTREFSNGTTPIYKAQPRQNLPRYTPVKNAAVPRQKMPPSPAKSATVKIKNNKEEINNTLPIRTPAREEGIIKNDLQEVFALWLEHKKQKGKPLTTETERRLAFERLQKLSGGNTLRAIDIVKQSIANGWSSLVELPKGTPAPNDIVKAFRVHLAELQAEAAKIAAEDEEYKRKINAPGSGVKKI